MNSPHPRSRRRSECKTQSKWRTEQARLSLHYDGVEETGEKRHHPSVEKLRKYFTRSYTVATAALTMTQYDSAANARPIRAALLTGGCLSEAAVSGYHVDVHSPLPVRRALQEILRFPDAAH